MLEETPLTESECECVVARLCDEVRPSAASSSAKLPISYSETSQYQRADRRRIEKQPEACDQEKGWRGGQ